MLFLEASRNIFYAPEGDWDGPWRLPVEKTPGAPVASCAIRSETVSVDFGNDV
jgi:hypothetical protein